MISANIDKETRKAIYRRDGYRCALCDSTKYIQIHHVIKRSEGGNDSKYNLITLCMDCHAGAHGTNLRNEPDYNPDDYTLSCVEYLADMYPGDYQPWKTGKHPLQRVNRWAEMATK